MAIGRISGPMLFSNLERQGLDLAIEGNLLYFDVNRRRIGVNTDAPEYDVHITGFANTQANVFINGTGGNWEFEHKGKEYHVKRIGEPHYKGIGNPKTDLYVELVEKLPGYGNQLKYSLKAANATFIENWMKPERYEQIFGKAKSIRIIMDMYDKLKCVNSIYVFHFFFVFSLLSVLCSFRLPLLSNYCNLVVFYTLFSP